MFEKETNSNLPELHWTAVFTAEFSNTKELNHPDRKTSTEEIEVKASGNEAMFHEEILKKLDTKRLEKSFEIGKIYFTVKRVKLSAFSDEARTKSVPSAKPHYSLNRSVEKYYNLKVYSLLRSASN